MLLSLTSYKFLVSSAHTAYSPACTRRRVADRDPGLRQTISPSAFAACNSSGANSPPQQHCAVGEHGRNCGEVDTPSARRTEWIGTLSRAMHAAVDEMLAEHQPAQHQLEASFIPPPMFTDIVAAAMGGELQHWRSAVMATALGSE